MIQDALRQSMELLAVVRSYQQRVEATVLKRSSATQTTEDKATQASLPSVRSSQASSEICALKESIKAISRKLRDINSSRSSGETFKTPEKSSEGAIEGLRLSFVDSPEFLRKSRANC